MLLTLLCCLPLAVVHAQTDSTTHDTAQAARIIDNYLGYVNFDPLLKETDSMVCVVSKVVNQSHPTDTLTIYRWYASGHRRRIEMVQGKKMAEGFYCDGRSVFRSFDTKRRVWRDLKPESFYDIADPLDIRGALYNWRSKGAEASYEGLVDYNGHKVVRVMYSSPGTFNRHYYFDPNNGLPFLVTEETTMFGDDKPAKNAQRVDWRAWHEFVPFDGYMMPGIESYQAEGDIVFIYHTYHLEKTRKGLFTEDFRKQ